jgi:repressor LexA
MLTQRQREVYEFVVSYVDSHGYPPTVREIGEAVGLASPSTVHAHLANLERAGYLRRDPTKPRALELMKRERAAAGAAVSVPDVGEVRVLPLVGEIAAGGPLLAEENVQDHLAVPDTLSRGGEEFLLRV